MEKIRLGLLGAGICANNFHFPALSALNDYYEIVALCGANAEQNEVLAGKAGVTTIYTDFNDLFADANVEAVISSYPYFLNQDVVKCALKNKKPLLMEKPIAKSLELAKEIKDLDDGSVVMGVAENWLYWDAAKVIKEQIATGAIGEVSSFTLTSMYYMDLESEYLRGKAWRRTADGGMIVDRTIHAVALCREVFGNVKRATGLIAGLREELGKTDTLYGLLEYESGVTGTIVNSASAIGIGLPYNLMIVGTKGTITVSNIYTKITVNTLEGSKELTADNKDGGYQAEFLDFYHAVKDETAFKSTFAGAYNDLFAVMSPLEEPGVWHSFKD